MNEEKTVKQLRSELVSLGMPPEDAELLNTKAQIVAAINAIRSATATKPTSLETPVDPKEEKETERRWVTKADRMKAFLESQPKVRVLIPIEGEEKPGVIEKVLVNGIEQIVVKSGAVWSKTFNGYKVIIPKGIYTDVPEQVAENISQEFSQTQAAGEQYKIDRIDPATGRSVREQLS